jgi:rare lipoprotein A
MGRGWRKPRFHDYLKRLPAAAFSCFTPGQGTKSLMAHLRGVRKRRLTLNTLGLLVTCAALSAMCAISSNAQVASRNEPGIRSIDTNSPQVQDEAHKLAQQPPVPPSRGQRIAEDHSGRKQVGKASIYAPHFQGQRMANGRKLDHRSRSAASNTLPLGTIAKVTNLRNGQTAVVTVEDHGPYVDGRTVDVTKSTADQLGIGHTEGVAPVVVAPIAVPQPDGTVKPGAGALPGPATAQ